jgi:hypothetical protein
MIKIEKTEYLVKVHLPIQTINFDRPYFDWLCDNIYFLSTQSPNSIKIIREKGNIEDMNMGHFLCLKNEYQANFNDKNMKVLDVESIVEDYKKYCDSEMERLGISF